MELKEAMKTLLDFIRCAEEEFGKVKYTSTSMNVDDGDIEAISTILQELERLQKENEKYMSGEVMTRNQAKHFEEITNKHYIHKNKIREKIEEIAGKQGYVFATEVLGDLLKEE